MIIFNKDINDKIIKLHLSEKVINSALKLIKSYEKEKGLNSSLRPSMLACGSLYLACVNNKHSATQEVIAKSFKASVVTVSRASHKIMECEFYDGVKN